MTCLRRLSFSALAVVALGCGDDAGTPAESDTMASASSTGVSSTGRDQTMADDDSGGGGTTRATDGALDGDDGSESSGAPTSTETGDSEASDSGTAGATSTDGGGRADCDLCIEEAFGVGGACEATLEACTADDACLQYLVCLDACADDLACETACVDATTPATDVLIEAIGTCVLAECPGCGRD